ncbi:phosphatidylglycerophosphate synthase [Sphingomonas oleivorans]|uniref:Phosphatidylglycerophosphate synthase n=1 Tax=Sphingomonas oleivorans TaxID=1735121 RepID=A0A2T5FY48_9SPHN|nr:CDP-alcohol phosphatidyltransferase family protein [Sphingomonas oleivorans]PTQ11455.1 phosphatidylglycerophosphate synthase [Sphingomonas oleivorans]
MDAKPEILLAGANDTRLWGLTSAERVGRIAAAQGLTMAVGSDVRLPALIVNLAYAFDPAWLKYVAARPNHVVTRGGVPVLAHVTDSAAGEALFAMMAEDQPLGSAGSLILVPQEDAGGIVNDELRKRDTPFIERLIPSSVPALERASYFGAYKGVTDILTKYLWPEWALVLTRLAARWRITPNQVTALGALLCVVATILFYYGHYWPGLAAGLGFMVLDTVDGKLARCTITSSWWGNIFDHGIDLIHPPFWWYAWGVGLAAYGRPLDPRTFWICMGVIVAGYVVQRLIEGAFIVRFGIHIHVWRRFDSWFRLITARRNPNMIILFASLLVGRPDLGLIAVAIWTLASLLVHIVQLFHALIVQAQGRPVKSWLG